MDKYRAEVELVRCELADGQCHNNAIRAEAAQTTGYLETEMFTLVAKSREAHEMHQAAHERYTECVARVDTTFNGFEQEAEASTTRPSAKSATTTLRKEIKRSWPFAKSAGRRKPTASSSRRRPRTKTQRCRLLWRLLTAINAR